MNTKRKKTGRKLLSFLLTLAMVVVLMPGMSLMALAWDGDPYAELLNTTTAVNFDGKEWYLIENNSTAVDAGTVTLLSKECVAASQYNSSGSYVEYASSTVKTAVDNWYNNNITSNAKTAVFDNKMFLLTKDQANAMTTDTRKCSQASEANYNYWWLCSPGSFGNFASCVYGGNGNVLAYGYSVVCALGVRPALKLNLDAVTFNSTSKTFSVIPTGYKVTYYANNGSGDKKEYNPNIGEKHTVQGQLFAAPQGKVFDNWLGDDNQTYRPESQISTTRTLTAQWKEPTSGGSVGGFGGDIVFNVPGWDDGEYYYDAYIPQRAWRVNFAPMQGGSASLGLMTGESGAQLSVYPQTSVYVFPNPDPGYEIASIVWSLIDGSASYDITQAKNFVMPAMDVVVYVTFRPVG